MTNKSPSCLNQLNHFGGWVCLKMQFMWKEWVSTNILCIQASHNPPISQPCEVDRAPPSSFEGSKRDCGIAAVHSWRFWFNCPSNPIPNENCWEPSKGRHPITKREKKSRKLASSLAQKSHRWSDASSRMPSAESFAGAVSVLSWQLPAAERKECKQRPRGRNIKQRRTRIRRANHS